MKRKKTSVLVDRQPTGVNYPQKEIITRLLREVCEICASTDDISVHHVARLADLAGPGPQPVWNTIMAKQRRKTIVVCRACSDMIHHRKPPASTQ